MSERAFFLRRKYKICSGTNLYSTERSSRESTHQPRKKQKTFFPSKYLQSPFPIPKTLRTDSYNRSVCISVRLYRYSQELHKTFHSTVSPSEFKISSNVAASGLLGIEPFVVVVVTSSLLSFGSPASSGSGDDGFEN